ncbi:helix-turn-helix transcriptional regulator [Streptomyces sp. NPDC055815]
MDSRPDQHERFIGRVRETDALARAIATAHSGGATMMVVEGPAGIGKTALVGHVLRTVSTRTEQNNLHTFRVTGVPWEADLPLGVAGQLLRAGGADASELPDGAASDAVLKAGLALHHRWTQQQAQRPLVVVVDDAQWADIESLRAIKSAVRRMSHERVLVLLVARDAPHDLQDADETPHAQLPPRALAVLDFLEGCRTDAVRPGPLNPEEVRVLAQENWGIALDLPSARHLCEHTLGNPQYLTQLLQELPADTWHEWQPELPAPARYTADVRLRLARCSESAQALVRACSILGSDISLAEAAELAEIRDPLRAADEARAAGLLTATLDPGHAQLNFTHPLARAAVVSLISLTDRATLHERAAVLITDPGRRLLHKVAVATTTDDALADELDRYAAERASSGEWSTAASTLVRAGKLTGSQTLRQDRILRAVDAMVGAGDMPQAAMFAAELERFPASTLRDVVLGYLSIMRGRPTEADMFLTQAWDRCDPERDEDLMAMICQRRVLHSLGRWNGNDMVTWAQRAIELAAPDDPSAVESEAVLGLGLAAMGRPADAVTAYESAAARLPAGAQPQRFRLGRGWVDLALDAPEAARRRLEAAVPTSYRMGSTRISLWAQSWLARTQFLLGVWPEALENVQRSARRLAEVRIELVRPMVHWTGAQIYALQGNWVMADHHLNEASADLHDYEVMLLPSCLARAHVAEARGEYDRVIEALSPIVHLSPREAVNEPGFWPWPDVYANALVLTGRLDEADSFLSEHETLASRRGRHSALARLGLARGRLTAARGDIETARKDFEQALAHLERLPLPYDRARVTFAFGQTLRRAGKRREADTVLKNARDAFVRLGAQTYVTRCDRELQAGGVHTSRSDPGLAQLTPQERAVARLVAAGSSNKQVALELYISVKTVQYHLTHVYTKLGIRSRSELAALFRETASAD